MAGAKHAMVGKQHPFMKRRGRVTADLNDGGLVGISQPAPRSRVSSNLWKILAAFRRRTLRTWFLKECKGESGCQSVGE